MSEERRRFFRIDDEVALSFHLIDDEYGGEDSDDLHTMQDMQQEFHVSLEVQIRQAMVDVRSQYPKLAPLLDLMNQKINLLHANEALVEEAPVLKKANLSACGIAFTWGDKLPINQTLMVNIYLQPNHELVRAEAHVAAVDNNPDHPTQSEEAYIVRLDFNEMHQAFQEVLIQHVVQRQGHQLRKKFDSNN
ncbi:hypothetical protein NBRC116188_27990 [Oceaniserpentilla sp. 4NH20-0058]|uniref:hypothetical protein n=1 Tax=Oceaniserpentilla sp. 4NH20-0058 TaxID=3127660 RepID=UPI003106FBE3